MDVNTAEEAKARALEDAKIGPRLDGMLRGFENEGLYTGVRQGAGYTVVVVAASGTLVNATPGGSKMVNGEPVRTGAWVKRVALAKKALEDLVVEAAEVAQDRAVKAQGLEEGK